MSLPNYVCMSVNLSVCGCLCACSISFPHVEVCTYRTRLERSYIYVTIAVDWRDAKRNMFESIRRRFAMKSSLFCYAIEKKKLYILMFCDSLLHTRNPTINVLKLAGRRFAMNQSHCAAMLKQKICLCVAVARSPLWCETCWNWWFRDGWQKSSPETLLSWLHFLVPVKL